MSWLLLGWNFIKVSNEAHIFREEVFTTQELSVFGTMSPMAMEDAQEWAEAWNAHKMEIRGQCNQSPREMFMFGMIQDGPQGIQQLIAPKEEEQELVDFASYGVDWDVNDDPVLMTHLLQHNPQDFPTDDPFGPWTTPHRLSDVPCKAPDHIRKIPG
ncbi:hypothetical protein PILCRDRAFT_1904 [Piloderma croceum F 1598]|uniref:Uncharacterized protein n=1 Tax=Piloderma croceum (strain F 1598) TaxID=765440 RepID=A0A0C3FZ29_PILCF|nr:hypothetical protein PILCRDRAFT_1904 [Piloderma croceum F 1598]